MAIAANLDSTGNDQTTSPSIASIPAEFHEVETANEVNQALSSVPSHDREPISNQPARSQSMYSGPTNTTQFYDTHDASSRDSSCYLCCILCCNCLLEFLAHLPLVLIS